MKRIYFDIETGPRPEAELEELRPEFSAPKNYKDPAKIAEYIAEEGQEWARRAPLSAVTGRVLAIGTRQDGENAILATGDETFDLMRFWEIVEKSARNGAVLAGFNIARFDIPFVIRRSWFLGVRVPPGVFAGRYLNHRVFHDLFEEWQCGDRSETISLRRLARFLGVGTKEEHGGALFAERWMTDRKAAIAYLENDLALTEAVALRLLGDEESAADVLPGGTVPVARVRSRTGAGSASEGRAGSAPARRPRGERAVPASADF